MASCSATRSLRKGAHSCVECRKRKIRCSRSSETAQSCRRCEERFLECIPQTVSAPSTSKPLRKTRDRVARLEDKVQRLTEAVRCFQDPSCGTDLDLSSASQSEAGETDTCPEMNIPNQPSYLNALFNNSILNSSDSHPRSVSSSVSSQLSGSTRAALQSLVPDKEAVILLAGTASRWLSLLHDIFPIMTDIKSGADILARYEEVLQPTADPLAVAAWLLVLAVTAQHNAGPQHQIAVRNRNALTGPGYSRLVAQSVERTVVTRDQLVTSVEGLATTTLLIRLHLTHGNFVQSFLLLRRALSIAELLGLPWSQPRSLLWQHICTAERFQSMVLGFPSMSQHYDLGKSGPVVMDGKIIPCNFLVRLSNLALDMNGPGDMRSHSISLPELQDVIAEREGNLRDLTRQMPNTWWSNDPTSTLSGRLMKFFCHYVTLRLHLPLFLRRDVSERGIQSRRACIDACRALLQEYIDVYPMILEGYFIQQAMDLQLFTAAVVLLLADHSCMVSTQGGGQEETDAACVSMKLIADVVQVLEQQSVNPRSDIADQTIRAIHTLKVLLGAERDGDGPIDAVLHVPLLGKLHARRKTEPEAQIAACSRAATPFVQADPIYELSDMDLDQVVSSNFDWSIDQAFSFLYYPAPQY